jgi:glycosyltransferase involved in cell wall biosynthesis
MHFDRYGVNVSGFLTAELGLGEVARNYVQAMRHLGMDLSLQDASFLTNQRKDEKSLSGFTTENRYPANLMCMNAPEIEQFLEKFGLQYMSTKYNIGSWWWEVEEIPQNWQKQFVRFDELWVGTEFIAENFRAVSSIPILTMPPLVVANPSHITRVTYDIDKSEFVFLFVFDFFSCFQRKNPLAVIEAFKLAFAGDSRVRLIIKSTNGSSFPEQFTKLHQACDHKQITLLDSYMSKKELCGLIECCDCYVSLHRTEGFGLPIAEAMLMKKPVIVTGWSGNLDFTTPENSLLVQYGFTTNTEDYGPYKIGMRWAEPDIEHAAKLMRVIFEDPAHGKTLGERGATTISERYGIDAVSDAIGKRLNQINEKVQRVSTLADYKNALLDLASVNDVPSIDKPNVTSAEHSKSGALAKLLATIESVGSKWWHSPILGAPLRFTGAIVRRVVILSLSGESMKALRGQLLDQTFEGIAHLMKSDADRIADLEARLKSLENNRSHTDGRI